MLESTRMSRIALVALLSLAVALTACKRESAPRRRATGRRCRDRAANRCRHRRGERCSGTTPAVAGVAAAPTFDAKAYAGTFSGQGTSLEIGADGTFNLEQAGAEAQSGTWTLEQDGEHILLDPDSKSEQDRRYKMVGNDELRADGGDAAALTRVKA